MANKDSELIKKAAFTIAIFSSFLTPFMISSLNIALPVIAKEFSTNAIVMGWIATSYLLATAALLVPMGKISDIYGRKKIFTYGIICFIVTSFLSGISNSAEMLIVFRILQGIGSSMIFSTSIAILTAVFPLSERGRVLGINAASVYTGLSLGPFIGGLITDALSFRFIFFIPVPIGIFIIYLVLKYLKDEWADLKGEKYDYLGAILYGVSITLILLGMSNFAILKGKILLLMGTALFVLFIFNEKRITSPLINLNFVLSNKVFLFSNLAALANYSATFAVTFLLSIYLQYIKGFSPKLAGSVIVILPVIMALFSPFSGRLSDRIEPWILATSGMFVIGVSFIPLIFIDETSSILKILFLLALQGFGFALFSSPNTNAIMSSVQRRYYGVASAVMSTMRMMGQSFSLGISLFVFSIYLGSAKIAPENYELLIKSVQSGFTIFSIISFLGMFASLKRGNIHK